MAFLEPDPTGVAGTLGLNGDQGIPPIAQNKPNAIKSLSRKYAGDNLTSVQQLYGKDVVNSFVKWELERAQRGIPPTSNDKTMQLLAAAKSKQAQTQAPDRDPLDFLGNAASDVGEIVTNLPKMPAAIAHDLVHAPEAAEAIGTGDINKIANAPVVRLIPGVYTASNLLQGNVKELVSHPVMTGLDVLPYAEAGLRIPVGEGTVGSAIADSKVGEAVGRAKGAVGRSLPGQLVREAFGHDTRDVSRILAEQTNITHQAAQPALGHIYNTALDKLLQHGTETANALDRAVPDVARQGQLKAVLEDPASVGAKDYHSALDALQATDAERAAVDGFRTWRDAATQYGLDTGELEQRMALGQNEIYTSRDAAKIDKARMKHSRIDTIASLRDSILHPDTADLSALEEKVNSSLQDPALKLRQKRAIAAGYIHALDVAGYDTGTMLSDASRAKTADLTSAIYDENGNLRASPGTEDGTVRTRRRAGTPSLDSRTRWLETHKEFTPKAAAKASAAAEAKEATVLPARWQSTFQRIKIDKAAGYIEQSFAADDPQVPALLESVHQHMYADLGKDAIRQINQEALDTVAELRKAGYDPEYIHHVSPAQERALASQSTTTLIPKASQYGVRINDWTPTSDSMSVSISHQGMELARARGTRVALDAIRDAHTTSVRDATAELRPIAERAAARSGNPVGAELERLMRKEYVRWSETESGFMAGRAKKFQFSDTNFAPDDLLVKRHIAHSLQMLASPPAYSRILDPVTKVFRTAILPFSPRFLTHHIGGGMLMSILEDPRIVAKMPEGMAFARDISDMQRAAVAGDAFQLQDATKAVLDRMPESMRAQINGLQYAYAPEREYAFKAGGKVGELAHQAGIDRIAKAGGKVSDWTFHTVDTMDTMYRAAAYLSGEQNALTKGLSAEEAGARGMALVNKVMPRWSEMTPMERSALRVVFPFYTFMSHVMRYAFRFPLDHPWRTAVMAGLSRAELDDFGTGLPQALASMMFLGSPDKSGNVTALNVGTINPFHTVGDNLTVAGFLSNTNPVFKMALTQLGYDPIARGPNIYPEVEYDPETGRFKATAPSTPSLLGDAVGSLVPQANILAAITGTSGDFRNLLESNPDAASRMMASASGIPLLWKKYNLHNEAFQAEFNRETDSKEALSTAMRTGDYTKAMRYPQLRATVRALQKLAAAGKLTPYEPGVTPSLAANNARQAGSQATTVAEVR